MRKVTSASVVVTFFDDCISEHIWLVAWNQNFLHLAVKGKGVRVKMRLDKIGRMW